MSSLRLFLVALLVTLGAIETAVRLVEPALYERAGDAYAVYLATERLLLRGREDSPVILFGGDSLTRENVAPYPLVAALDMQRGAILNLATSGGRPSDLKQFYRDYRARLGRARLLVYGVDAGQFNAASESALDNRFRIRSSLPDRLRFPLVDKVPDLALGYFWKLWDLRPELHEQGMEALKQRRFGRPLVLRFDSLGRVQSDTRYQDPSADAAFAARHLETHAPWEFELAALRELFELARADGVRVVAVEWPTRTSYALAVERQFAAQDRAWKDAVRATVGEAAFVEARSPAQWGLTDADFYDYGHLSEQGSRRFSQALADWTAGLLADPRRS